MKAIAAEAENRHIAAMLWGVHAQRMRRHLEPSVKVFVSSHPAPRSANRTAGGEEQFCGSHPFAKVNKWFRDCDDDSVDWTLTE